MGRSEAQKLEDFVLTTCFILRLFIFILLGAQVDFALIGQYWLGGRRCRRGIDAGRASGDGIPVRSARSPRALELREMLFMCWTRETGVIPAALAGLLAA